MGTSNERETIRTEDGGAESADETEVPGEETDLAEEGGEPPAVIDLAEGTTPGRRFYANLTNL